MGWNYNLMPLDYLEKRLKYYQRQQKYIKGLLKKELVIKNNKASFITISTKKNFTPTQLRGAIKNTEKYIIAFNTAILKLKV